MTRYRFATPRPGEDVLTRVPRRTGAPRVADASQLDIGRPNMARWREPRANPMSGAPYRHAHPADPVRMAHPIRPEPLPAHRSRIAPDLLAIAVILAVVLAASLAGVRP